MLNCQGTECMSEGIYPSSQFQNHTFLLHHYQEKSQLVIWPSLEPKLSDEPPGFAHLDHVLIQVATELKFVLKIKGKLQGEGGMSSSPKQSESVLTPRSHWEIKRM